MHSNRAADISIFILFIFSRLVQGSAIVAKKHISAHRYGTESQVWRQLSERVASISCAEHHLPELVHLLDDDFVIVTRPRADRNLSDLPFSMDFFSAIAKALNTALTTLHSAAIFHLDLHESNVLFTENGMCFLNDFSCAVPIDTDIGIGVSIQQFVGNDNFASNIFSVFRATTDACTVRYSTIDDYKSLVLLLLHYCSREDNPSEPRGLLWHRTNPISAKWLLKLQCLADPEKFIFPRIHEEVRDLCMQLFDSVFRRNDVAVCQELLATIGALAC